MTSLSVIARVRTDFPEKFGLPRQSGIVPALTGTVVFEEAYRVPDALRGIEGFSHLWLLWGFSEGFSSQNEPKPWSPTVRPPRLGGNARMGVFATRSPNRPNPIGLTRVRLISLEQTAADGPVLTVSGADLMSGTEILDIKPYLPFADSVPEAATGEYGPDKQEPLNVEIPESVAALFTSKQLSALREALSYDPRPGYQTDENRGYGFAYGGYDIRFRVSGQTATVTDAIKIND